MIPIPPWVLIWLERYLTKRIGKKIVGEIFKSIFKAKFVKRALIGVGASAAFAIGSMQLGMSSVEFKAAVCGVDLAPENPLPHATPDPELEKALENR